MPVQQTTCLIIIQYSKFANQSNWQHFRKNASKKSKHFFRSLISNLLATHRHCCCCCCVIILACANTIPTKWNRKETFNINYWAEYFIYQESNGFSTKTVLLDCVNQMECQLIHQLDVWDIDLRLYQFFSSLFIAYREQQMRGWRWCRSILIK